MKLKTEIINIKQKTIIISNKNYQFFNNFKKELKKYNLEIFFSSLPQKNYENFDFIFFVNKEININIIKENPSKKFIFIFLKNHQPSSLLKNSSLKNLKIIKVIENSLSEQDIDKILWFIFSKSKENYLNIIGNKEKTNNIKNKNFINEFYKYLSLKYLILFTILSILFFSFLFLPFFTISTFLTYKTYQDFKKNNFQQAYLKNNLNKKILTIGENLYFSKPILRILGIGFISDNILDINKNTITLIDQIKNIKENSKIIQKLIFQKNKNQEEINELKAQLDKFNYSLDNINLILLTLNQKIPSTNFLNIKNIKNQLLDINDLLEKIKKINFYLSKIINQTNPQRYLLLFANNMEIRPGGGFIGSFGILEINNYQIEEIKVYDVYDADGQLTAHIDPPKPLEQYLGVKHFFLRDSNFTPDFFDNYEKALFFIEKTLNIKEFNGGILFTTTAIENILSSFDNIYLPDFKEYINAENFYIKTQHQVENNFFPGSIKKKSFLNSLIRQIIINLENANLEKLILGLRKSLDEKQIVIYINDESIQNFLDKAFWSGRIISPKCLTGSNCIVDFIFPFDANVGANKANFFINRFFNLKTFIDKDGNINHSLSIQYKNSSPSEIFPTGNYRNYFQILLPKDIILKTILKDGVLIENIDQKDGQFKLIGFFFEVPAKKTIEIKINYQLKDKIISKNQIYQLIFQKQIGSNNSDLILDFNLPKNITSLNQNFSPLVKNQQILYNTSLSTDKIFFIEFNKN